MRIKRKSTSKSINLNFNKEAEANLKFLFESTSTLLGVKLTQSILIRRALELLADRWMTEAVETLSGKSSPERKMEKLSEFLKTEREELLRAAGRSGEKVWIPAVLKGEV